MAQSLLTQHGAEYASTMRTLQAVAAKKHLVKKWRSRNQSCSESSSSSSYSCSSSDSDGEGSSSKSSTTAEREFSIVKESNFANGPLKLKIAARRVKKAEDVTYSLDQDECSLASPCRDRNCRSKTSKHKVSKCKGEKYVQGERKSCKRKSSQKRCLKTKGSRVPCNGQYPNCKGARKVRHCSTSGSSSSSSSSGSTSGSSGSSSSSTGSSTVCSSNSSSGSSSRSSSSSGSSSSSSSSGSSSSSESDSCCTDSNCNVCKRQKAKLSRKASTKCQATCTLEYKPSHEGTNSSRASFSNDFPRRLSDKSQTGKGKHLLAECAKNKKLQVSDIDYFTNSSSDDNMSLNEEKENGIQESLSMWHKMEEKHCAFIEDAFKSADLQMQVLSVTNAEVECNINVSGKIDLLEDKNFINTKSCTNQKSTNCDFNFTCIEELPSDIKENRVHPSASLDLDALPVTLSNVSPDSGIQSSGDSPMRGENEMPSSSQTESESVNNNHTKDYFERTHVVEVLSGKPDTQHSKHVSPTPSPPVLTPPDPVWTPSTIDPLPIVDKQKNVSDDHPAPLLMQEIVDANCKIPSKIDSIFSDFRRIEFSNDNTVLQHNVLQTISSDENNKINLTVSTSISCDGKVLNTETFASNSLHLMFSNESMTNEKNESPAFPVHPSPQSTYSESKRRRTKSSKRQSDNSKADNELHLLVQSVQDSICSQFQGMESDELSDVDVNSIPVTALTCDATSDSFCDKLPGEDNIDMFLDDRTYLQTEDKIKNSPKDSSCNAPCSTAESEFLTNLCLKLPEKDPIYVENPSKLLDSNENQVTDDTGSENVSSFECEQIATANITNEMDVLISDHMCAVESESPPDTATQELENKPLSNEGAEAKKSESISLCEIKELPEDTTKMVPDETVNEELVEDTNEAISIEDSIEDTSINVLSKPSRKKSTKKGRKRKSRGCRSGKISTARFETSDVDNEGSNNLNLPEEPEKEALVFENKNVSNVENHVDIPEISKPSDFKCQTFDKDPSINDINLLMEIPITVIEDNDTSKMAVSNIQIESQEESSISEFDISKVQSADSPQSVKISKQMKSADTKHKSKKGRTRSNKIAVVDNNSKKLTVEPSISDIPKLKDSNVDEGINQNKVEDSSTNVENIPDIKESCNVIHNENSVEKPLIDEHRISLNETTHLISVSGNSAADISVSKSIVEQEKVSKSKKTRKSTANFSKLHDAAKVYNQEVSICSTLDVNEFSDKNTNACIDHVLEINETDSITESVKSSSHENKCLEFKTPYPKESADSDSIHSQKKIEIVEKPISNAKSPRTKRKKELDSKNIYDNVDAIIEEVSRIGLCPETRMSTASDTSSSLEITDKTKNETFPTKSSSKSFTKNKSSKKSSSIEKQKNTDKVDRKMDTASTEKEDTQKSSFENPEILEKKISKKDDDNRILENRSSLKNVSSFGEEVLNNKCSKRKSSAIAKNEVLDNVFDEQLVCHNKSKIPEESTKIKSKKGKSCGSKDNEINPKIAIKDASVKEMPVIEKQSKQKAIKTTNNVDPNYLNSDIQLDKEYLQKKAARRRLSNLAKKDLISEQMTTKCTDSDKKVHNKTSNVQLIPEEIISEDIDGKSEAKNQQSTKSNPNSNFCTADLKSKHKKVKEAQSFVAKSKREKMSKSKNQMKNRKEISDNKKEKKGSSGKLPKGADKINVDTECLNNSETTHTCKHKRNVKMKVDEEKENFDIRKPETKSSRQKTKQSKEGKESSQKMYCEDIERIHYDYSVEGIAGQSKSDVMAKDIEKQDITSSMYVDDDGHVSGNLSDTYVSGSLDKHEMKFLKKKKPVKKYSEDPNFIADLEELAKLLKNCCISKRSVKFKEDNAGYIMPAVFQLKKFIKHKNEKSHRQPNSASKIPKCMKSKPVFKKKPKRCGKKEAVSKAVVPPKPKSSVNENCLPLKKRRCLVPNNQTAKVVAENAASKAPVKKSLCLRNSFDETIEDCIKKHMMSDEVASDKEGATPGRSKLKKARKATIDAIDEAIDNCVKFFTPKEKSNAQKEENLDVDDVPLAALAKLNNKKTVSKAPKISSAALAYRNKRKRLLKEACEQAQKVTKQEPTEIVNGQKKRRRFRNRTGFVRIKKKKTKPSISETAEINESVSTDKDVIDLTKEDNVIDAIESVVKSCVEDTRSRRKRKNVAQKCEIEILDIASGNDDDVIEECSVSKKPKPLEDDDEKDSKCVQIIQVTESSSGRKMANSIDPRKARKPIANFPKKKYLRAGLYSATFKQEAIPVKKTSSKKSKSKEIKEYNPEDFEFGLLPPPIHVGKYLREKKSEFKLPFDLWWLHINKQLVYNDELANNYKKIRQNVYVDIKPDTNYDYQACNCSPPRDSRRKGCGADCLNRMMYVECTPQLCPCNDLCSNQRILKHDWSPGLQRFMTKDRGWGIRTTEFIRNGEFILEYVGEVVSDTEFRHRMAERYLNDQHHYCLSLDSGTVIDGYRLAGEGRFVNHSCEPNCEMQKWYVNGHYRVGLFALRDIYPNTELCYDYNFINYNLETQQVCRCGSDKCRGFIGGRSQRVNGQNKEKPSQKRQAKQKAIIDSKKGPGRPKKRKDDKPVEIQKEHIKNEYLPYNRQSFTIQMKPMSHQQRCYVQKHHCFLLRNYEKVKKAKDQARLTAEKEADVEKSDKQDAFHTQFTALNTARSVKTRRLAVVVENTEVARTAKLAQVFKDVFTAVTSCKGDDGNALASPFFQLPSKRKNPEYFNKIKFPIDFAMIEKNIITGQYCNVDAFEDDFLRLFENAEEYYGRTSDNGHKISHLRKVYESAKTDAMILFEDILGETLPTVFIKSDDKADEDDEVIRCICNIYKDEGLMIQCEKCLVWQHCDCVGVDGKVEKYLCEQCSGIELSKEILMVPQPHYASPECQYYLTLLKNDLQIKQGDCVYLKRDIEGDAVSSNESVQDLIIAQGMESGDAAARESLRGEKSEQLDIFRIERLWKDDKSMKFAFGHHYLRPHETFHEPSRKFFSNEVFRVPLYEVVSFDSIVSHCCVLDLPTYCKGRPKGFKEEDVYICEYRVDKTAHFFNKIAKLKYPICTKKYAFDHFEKRLNPKRTFLPHTVPSAYRRRANTNDRGSSEKKSKSEGHKEEKKKRSSVKNIDTRLEESAESREKKRCHLNELLLKLLIQMPCKQTVDLSYLLEGGLGKRIRRKTNLSMS